MAHLGYVVRQTLVAIEVEREEDEGGMVGETFTDSCTPKQSIGPPHPDSVVETSSWSAVQPLEPTYDPLIKDYFESSKALSCLQIETLVHACQRHLQDLPNGTRAGLFVGDGTGVGKGRTIAGLIWENWHHGRRKALVDLVGLDLKFDARRNLDGVGTTCVEGLLESRKELCFSLTAASLHLLRKVVLDCSSLCSVVDQGMMALSYLMRCS